MNTVRRTARGLQELRELAEDMRRKAEHLHKLTGYGEWPYDLATYADRLDSTVRYIDGDDQ